MTPDVLATLQQHLLQCLASPPSEVRRLLHGRGRCWPGLEQLTVDWLQGTLLVCLYRDPGAAALAALAAFWAVGVVTQQPLVTAWDQSAAAWGEAMRAAGWRPAAAALGDATAVLPMTV